MNCEQCGTPRKRLYHCATCGKRLCGGCSYKMKRGGKRVCTTRGHLCLRQQIVWQSSAHHHRARPAAAAAAP